MTPDERLIYEARQRTRQAIIAGAAGLLLLVATVLQTVGPKTNVTELTIGLIYANKRHILDVAAAILEAGGVLAVAATLTYLFGATQARNEGVQPWLRGLAIVGGVMTAVSAIANAILIAVKGHDFVTQGTQTYEEAHHLTSSPILVVFQYSNLLGVFLIAMALVMISLNAMRAGLLTRFIGYLGIFAGVLTVIPLVPLPIVEIYWLFAVGYLFSGRWPTGVPPAWRSGRAERWPTSAELREQRMRASGRGPGRGKAMPQPATETVGAASTGRTRSSTSKRKRKRRR
jgi:hypothetical protein